MPEDSNFRIDIPEMEVEVGIPQTVTITFTNITAFLMKSISVKSDIPESEIMGIIPEQLLAGRSFQMQLSVSPKIWNPDGIKGTISVDAKMVSR